MHFYDNLTHSAGTTPLDTTPQQRTTKTKGLSRTSVSRLRALRDRKRNRETDREREGMRASKVFC